MSPEHFRAKAAEYIDLAKSAGTPESAREFQKLEQSFRTLADNEQWLSEHRDQTVNASDCADESSPTSADEEHTAIDQDRILRCLGAAVVVHWNTVPTKLQRELFDTAGTMGEILDSGRLRAQIARFLHRHKNDDSSA